MIRPADTTDPGRALRGWHRAGLTGLLLATLLTPAATAADPDNCLLCHQFRGLSRFDAASERVHLFTVDPHYMLEQRGPHARLACTDCHPRDEVSVIPHRPTTAVSCTQTCHLSSASGAARRFSHVDVERQLAASVHAPEVLARLRFAGGPLLAPEQSTCLYCHDEPVFRDPAHVAPVLAALGGRAFDRCESCHRDQVPKDTNYYVRHIGARLQPARAALEQAQICAVCHADEAVLEDTELSSAVASFVRSFHGKAALLGDDSTANCSACHVAAGADPHLMLAQRDPRSSVHPTQVANSCRATACHPGADPGIAAAAVHLDLPTQRATLEFAIALAFIVLTAVSFGPSLVICLLELFQIVIGRHHHRGPALHATVAAVLAHPQGRARLARFTVNQRVQHWILAVLFTLLALTGFPMKFADHLWARTVIDGLGGLGTARVIHHWAGIALVIGFAAHFVYCVATLVRRAAERRADGRRTGLVQATWNLPMMVRPADLLKAHHLMLYLVGLRREPPTFDRFTIKEKFEYLGVAWGTTLLGVTGALLWGEQIFTHYVGGRVLNIALIAHTYEAFLAIIHVGILHIVNVVFSPHVFPLSRATLSGDTPAAELAEQHSDFVEAAARDLGINVPTGGGHG
jgi:cytochrome b subunit of formate dehydrogenase